MADVITRFKVETQEYDRKIDKAKDKLDKFGRQGQETGKMFQEFTNKLGVSIPKLGALSLGLGAAAGALKVAKDAFFKNEGTLDEWGRTVESSKTIYEGFLVSLNTGDFSGFLTRINSIVHAARNAYDALDELATFNAYNQVNIEKGKYEFQESIVNFKEGTGSKEDVEKSAQNLKDLLEERRANEQEAYESKLREFAARDGVSYESLKEVMTGKYGDYKSLKKLGLTGVKSEWGTTQYGAPYEIKSRVAANEEEKMGQMLRQLNDTELQNLQALGAQAQRTAQEMEQINRQVLRYTNETTKGNGGGGASKATGLSPAQIAANIEDANSEMSTLIQNWLMLDQTIGSANSLQQFLNGESMSEWADEPIDNLKELQKRMDDYRANIEDTARANQIAAQTFGQVAGAIASIDNPAAKILGTLGQAIAQVALAYSESLAKDKTSKSNIWSFIAASTAATISMVSTIASIKSNARFADGGIVPGNKFSGDQTPILANAGEVVLNKAQQSALASQLQQGSQGGVNAQPYVNGEQIWLGVNNYLKRTGRGELVTSR